MCNSPRKYAQRSHHDYGYRKARPSAAQQLGFCLQFLNLVEQVDPPVLVRAVALPLVVFVRYRCHRRLKAVHPMKPASRVSVAIASALTSIQVKGYSQSEAALKGVETPTATRRDPVILFTCAMARSGLSFPPRRQTGIQ
jgi:hypothetical protein